VHFHRDFQTGDDSDKGSVSGRLEFGEVFHVVHRYLLEKGFLENGFLEKTTRASAETSLGAVLRNKGVWTHKSLGFLFAKPISEERVVP
jgi:hypothetical protein